MTERNKNIDGGWAWMIFIANTLCQMIIVPLLLNFSLVFKNQFTILGIGSTDITSIITTNSSFGMILGVFSTPLIKKHGCRAVALMSAIVYCVTTYFPVHCSTTLQFMIVYGLMNSLGRSFMQAAFSLSFNTYFRKKRRRATSFMMTISGSVQIVLPLIVDYILNEHGLHATVLFLTGFSLQLLVAACLLRPLAEKKRTAPAQNQEMKDVSSSGNRLNGLEADKTGETSQKLLNNESVSRTKIDEHMKTNTDITERDGGVNEPLNRPQTRSSTWAQYFYTTYDLDLLKNLSYIVTIISMGLAVVSEIIFNLMLPFILQDFGLDSDYIAKFFSVASIGDIILRFLAPYIGEILKLQTKGMYAVALLTVLVARSGMYIASSNWAFMVVACLVGMTKGFRIVYWNLVLPDTVPLDKLASASAINMMTTGILMQVGGPIAGAIVAVFNDYTTLVTTANVLTLVAVILLLIDINVINRGKVRQSVES